MSEEENKEDDENEEYDPLDDVFRSLPLGFELSNEDAFTLRTALFAASMWFFCRSTIRARYGGRVVDHQGANIFFLLVSGLVVDDYNKLHFNTKKMFMRVLWMILPGIAYRIQEAVEKRLPFKGGGMLLAEEVSLDNGMPIPKDSTLYSVTGPDDAIHKLLKHFVPRANMDAMVNELIDKMKVCENYEEFIVKEKDLIHTFATKLAAQMKGKRRASTRSVRSARSPSRRRTRSARF